MSRRPRWAAVASALALLASYGAVQSQDALAASSETVSDPRGDISDPRSDVVSASAEYLSNAIVMKALTVQPVNFRDASGMDPQNSTANWVLDVNGDSKVDYHVEWGVDGGNLYADVYNSLDQNARPVCTGSPSIAGDGSYVVSLPLNCVGNPKSFRWGGIMQFTPAGQPEAPSDLFPDTGYFGPLEKPGSTPAPTTPPTPPGGTPAPTTPPTTAPRPIVVAPVAANEGFWLLGKDGGVFSFGTAKFYGSIGHLGGAKQIVSMAADPDGTGYWFVGADGGIFAYKAPFWGSTGNIRLSKPIVGMAATPSGKGYWLVASDGGIFAFGDAGFYGSTGSITLNEPIVGMASTPSGKGYWFVASDGGIFGFGDAPFFGSAVNGNPVPVVGMATTKTGVGYRVARADGSVTAFGSAAPGGGLTGSLVAPMVGIVTAP